jgi:hypothetical protein
MNEPIIPSLQLLVKLGSLVIHYQEATGPKRHPLDMDAIRSIEGEPDVQEWISEMTKRGFLPVKR